MWDPKTALVKKTAEIAKKKYPNGYTKQQLIDASKEVYGGYGVAQVNPLVSREMKTLEGVSHMGNAMSQIDGRYPTGMSGCDIVGINGGCGLDCPVYLDGGCREPGEMLECGLSDDEMRKHIDLYGKD